MEHFARFTDADGFLSAAAFSECFADLMAASGADDAAQSQSTLARLFSLFDSNGDARVSLEEFLSVFEFLSQVRRQLHWQRRTLCARG